MAIYFRIRLRSYIPLERCSKIQATKSLSEEAMLLDLLEAFSEAPQGSVLGAILSKQTIRKGLMNA
jgi:hypothetical protein